MKKLALFLVAGVLAVAGAVIPATSAHAADPGPEIWTKAYEWDGPGTGQIDESASSVRTLDCETIVVEENRDDRSTRYHRVEKEWPAESEASRYPANQRIITVLKPYQVGWNIVYSWTPGTESSDLARVVWVPPCDEDLSAHTNT